MPQETGTAISPQQIYGAPSPAASGALISQPAAATAYSPMWAGENPGLGGYGSVAAEQAAMIANGWNWNKPPSGAWDYQYSGGSPIPGTEAYALAQQGIGSVAGGPLGYSSGGGQSSITGGYTPRNTGPVGSGGGVSGFLPTSDTGGRLMTPAQATTELPSITNPYDPSGSYNIQRDYPGMAAGFLQQSMDPSYFLSNMSGGGLSPDMSIGGAARGDIPGSPVDTNGMQTASGTEPTFASNPDLAPRSDMTTMPEVVGGLTGNPLPSSGDFTSLPSLPSFDIRQTQPTFGGTGGPTDVGPQFGGSENPSGPSSIPSEAFSQTPLSQQRIPLMTGATSDPFGPPVLGTGGNSSEPTFASRPLSNQSGGGGGGGPFGQNPVLSAGDPTNFQTWQLPFTRADQGIQNLGTTTPTVQQMTDEFSPQNSSRVSGFGTGGLANETVDLTKPVVPQILANPDTGPLARTFLSAAPSTPPPGTPSQSDMIDAARGFNNPGIIGQPYPATGFIPPDMSTGLDSSTPQRFFGDGGSFENSSPLPPSFSGGSGTTYPQIPNIGDELSRLDQGPQPTFAQQPLSAPFNPVQAGLNPVLDESGLTQTINNPRSANLSPSFNNPGSMWGGAPSGSGGSMNPGVQAFGGTRTDPTGDNNFITAFPTVEQGIGAMMNALGNPQNNPNYSGMTGVNAANTWAGGHRQTLGPGPTQFDNMLVSNIMNTQQGAEMLAQIIANAEAPNQNFSQEQLDSAYQMFLAGQAPANRIGGVLTSAPGNANVNLNPGIPNNAPYTRANTQNAGILTGGYPSGYIGQMIVGGNR